MHWCTQNQNATPPAFFSHVRHTMKQPKMYNTHDIQDIIHENSVSYCTFALLASSTFSIIARTWLETEKRLLHRKRCLRAPRMISSAALSSASNRLCPLTV